MSIETVNQFYQVITQDPALKLLFQTAAESKSDQEFLQMAVEQGQKHGYNFTTEDVAQAIAATQLPAETDGNVELSDQQLEAVAGGASKAQGVADAAKQAGRDTLDALAVPGAAIGGFFSGLFNTNDRVKF